MLPCCFLPARETCSPASALVAVAGLGTQPGAQGLLSPCLQTPFPTSISNKAKKGAERQPTSIPAVPSGMGVLLLLLPVPVAGSAAPLAPAALGSGDGAEQCHIPRAS